MHNTGKKELSFSTMEEFKQWKEIEEESTYTNYFEYQSAYYPAKEGMSNYYSV